MSDSIIPPCILAFDTAMSGCSVAVFDAATGDGVSESRPMVRGQSEALVPMLQEILARAGRSFADIGLIATTIGPGAFTGLRIGLSTARSLALALDIPAGGVTTTEVIARTVHEKLNPLNEVMVVLETKREDFYAQHFPRPPVAISREDLYAQYQDTHLTLCGDGVSRLMSGLGGGCARWVFEEGFDLPDPSMIARIAWENLKAGALRPPAPLYLRDADVSQSSRPARTIAREHKNRQNDFPDEY